MVGNPFRKKSGDGAPKNALVVDPGANGTGGPYVPAHVRDSFAQAGYCGHSFNLGMLRFHDSVSGPHFRELVLIAFPEITDPDADVLAFDWMGRQFVTMRQNPAQEEAELYLADLGTGTIEHFATINEFAGIIRVPQMAELLDVPLYEAWKKSVGAAGQGLEFGDCVEYQVPLTLGGSAGIDNLELNDLDMAWTIGGQVRLQTKDLKPGDPVPQIVLE